MWQFISQYRFPIILGALLAVIWVTDKAVDQKADFSVSASYSHITADLVDRVELITSENRRVILRDGDDWMVDDVAVSARAMEALFALPSRISARKLVSFRQSDYAKYGLKPARWEIGYKLGEVRGLRLRVGRWNPKANKTYILIDSSASVYAVTGNIDLTDAGR